MIFIGRLLKILLDVYVFGLIAYVILTWIPNPEVAKTREWLSRFYKPALAPLQKKIKPIKFGNNEVDMTPIILIFAIAIVGRIVSALFF